VVSDGCFGVTLKHSPPVSSLASGTPVVVCVKLPRQQYRPAEVTVAEFDTSGWAVFWLTVGAPAQGPLTAVPPLVQRPGNGLSGPMKQRGKAYGAVPGA